MGNNIKKKNPKTGEWEVFGSTDALDINILDASDNYESTNVEGALREIAESLKENAINEDYEKMLEEHDELIEEHEKTIKKHKDLLDEHAEAIEWLKENGGGGDGSGTATPTITSSYEGGIIEKNEVLKIPIFFSSPNLGEGTAYITLNGIEIAIVPNIKQGNNTIEIGILTEINNKISIYVKDRANLLSNQLEWTVICGGLEIEVTFDDTADYLITDIISMQFNVTSVGTDPIIMYMTIGYEEYEIECVSGFNEYTFKNLGVGVHKVSFHLESGIYSTPVQTFNIVVVNSNSLYVSTVFQGGQFTYGYPIAIQYRISKATNETFEVNLILDNNLNKTLNAQAGTYYWTLNEIGIGNHTFRIEVSSAYDEFEFIEGSFEVIAGDYKPLSITESGLLYRLSAYGRTNQDEDREFPVDDSGNGVVTTLHNFNYFTNGWIDNELVCNGNAYVEIDLYPYRENAIYGSTIEIQFSGIDLGFTDARIFDYTDIDTPYRGAYIDLEESEFKSLANSGKVNIDKESETTVTFVIDRSNKFGKIYVNGVCSRAFALSDSGSGTGATRESFEHKQKIYLNSKKGKECFGACKIKDIRVYNRVLSADEIVKNYIAQERDMEKQEKLYKFNYENTTLPVIRMYGDTKNMTLETPVTMRIKYTSPNEDLYGQSFDLPYCQVNWQGTSSLQYVLKNFTARLKDESMADYMYTPYANGVLENVFCFKADYMESTHSRNVGIAKFVNECLYDSKNPMQLKDPKIRNTITGFPCLMYINDELQGVYNFNLDRYSTYSYGYDDKNCLVYEVSANSDTTAGAFFRWSEDSGKAELDYYKSDFECVYPPSRLTNDNMSELKRLIEWVDSSSDEDFKDNIGRYFNLEYLLRYYLFVLVFGAVDSLGKNMKLATWDGLIWYPQVYDADTTIGLDNTGFLKFGTDIEMGDVGVFNTTGSRLWQKVVLLFQNELRQQYALMRQGRFTVDNIMKYLYGEQISQIPATYYNQDMQTKYLNFGSSYLYALHGNGEQHIRKWIRERLVYVDSLLGYMVDFDKDKITLRSSKLGYVYLDIETYIPMYVSVKWRDEANNTGMQTKRVGKGEKVRFEYNMPTATDQEILVYAGYYLKKLGNVSNLEPTSMLIANASRLTEIECHSPNLINTDLSQCKLLQKIDLSDSTALGTGLGAQPILNIQNCQYLKYCNCYNTQLTAIYTMAAGGNLEEIYYPESTQVIQLQNQTYLHTVGIPYDEENSVACENLAQVTIENCKNIKYIQYPFKEGEPLNFRSFKYVQNMNIVSSLDGLKAMSFEGFERLQSVNLSSLYNLESLSFDDMLLADSTTSTINNITLSDCPLIDLISFNVSSDDYKVAFREGCRLDLGGMQSVVTIESNYAVKGLDTLIIPTSVKELKFTNEYGEGVNELKRILSATSPYIADESFEGIDLIDINLTFIDMACLGITNAVNFHLAPTYQNPHFNTYRDGVNQPYFRPSGSLDLSNYEGDMVAMFKGLDLTKFSIIINKEIFSNKSIASLFEGAYFEDEAFVKGIVAKFPSAEILDYIFKDTPITDASDISFPLFKFSLMGGFMGSKLQTDFEVPTWVSNLTNCFRGCLEMTSIRSLWNRTYVYQLEHEDCYRDCINIALIDYKDGSILNVPVSWGGNEFNNLNHGIYLVQIPANNYSLVLGDLIEEGTVEWGDSEGHVYTRGENTHKYAKSGLYTIMGKIYPNAIDNNPHPTLAQTLLNVQKLPTTINSFKNMFNGCQILNTFNASDADTSHIVNMDGMMKNCTSLTTAPFFNYSSVMSAREMFKGCTNLLSLSFEDLSNANMDCTDIIEGCINLLTLEFTGKINKNVARSIIDILNDYILENTITTSELNSELYALNETMSAYMLRNNELTDNLNNEMSMMNNEMFMMNNELNNQNEMLNSYIEENNEKTDNLNNEVSMLNDEINNQNEIINSYIEENNNTTNYLVSELTNLNETISGQMDEITTLMLITASMYEVTQVSTMSKQENVTYTLSDIRMAQVYVKLIKKGVKTIEEIPSVLHPLIKELLDD